VEDQGEEKVEVKIHVIDFGIGISQDDLINLFTAYFKTKDQ
jgi:signal transduction histidine kinase